MGVYVFSHVIIDEKLLNNVYKIFIIEIFVLFVIYILGLGNWYGNSRYMSTFNDPNQFGFFVLISILYIYTLENIVRDNKRFYPVYLVAAYLIILSSSTGMVLGLSVFFALIVLGKIPVLLMIAKKMLKSFRL